MTLARVIKSARTASVRMADTHPEAKAPSAPSRPPYQKKKVAIVFGYSGTGYSGLQFNPGCRTLEQALFSALKESGMIWERNAADPHKVDWQRACRTDKGVHAAGNIVSLKALLITKGSEAEWDAPWAVMRLNEKLPEQMRVFDIVRVTNSFDSHSQCDSRFYEYVMPTFVLRSVSAEDFFAGVEKQDEPLATTQADDDFDLESSTVLSSAEAADLRAFRLDPDALARLREVLGKYVGTRSFHNFTLGKAARDPSASRFIRSFAADLPFVDSTTQVEWIRLRVHGASFMLHQIRKMVGLAVLSVRFGLGQENTERLFASAFGVDRKLNIPKAPGVGLYLDRACFDGYNKYLAATPTAIAEPLDVSKYDSGRERLKEDLIYPAVFAGWPQFVGWLRGLKLHNYEFKYLLDL